MRAVLMRSFGGPDVLQLEEVRLPSPAPGEALVRVAAVEVARTRDVATRTGQHAFSRQVRLPHVLGGDFAGVVEAVGDDVDPALVGRRVAAMNTSTCGHCLACRSGRQYECTELRMVGIHRWGSYAEHASVPASSLYPRPDDLPLVEAAAMAATGPIALTQLQVAALPEGASVLVTGITGALASVIAALAPRLGVAVIGSTRRPALVPASLGASVLDVGDAGFADHLRAASAGTGPDGVIDNVGAPEVFDRYLPTLPNGARIVVSGALDHEGQPPVVRVPLGPFYVRSLSLIGVRTATSAAMGDFWSMVGEGFRLPAGLIRQYALPDAAQAHADIAAGSASGHSVLVVDPTLAGPAPAAPTHT